MTVIVENLLKGIIYFVGFLFAVFLGSPLVSSILSRLRLTKDQEKLSGIKGAGKIIGMIERALTVTFIYLNEPTGIAIVFAAKSIVRFESAKERAFAEYYLIGTMTSITFAAIAGALFTLIGNIVT